jgi:hypothetical protein
MLALATALPFLGACKSSGADKAQATVSSVSKLEMELQNASDQVSSTLQALDAIVAEPEGDLRPAYDAYTKALSDLKSASKRVSDEGAAVRSKANSYYTDWEKNIATITNTDIKERAEKRRSEMLKKQEEANAWILSFGQRFDSFVTELEDIRAYLETDLNSAGVKSITGQVKDTKKDGQAIQKDLDKLVAALTDVRESTSATGSAAPPQQQ